MAVVSASPSFGPRASWPSGLFIEGDWRPSAEGGKFPVECPSTGERIGEVADGSVEDALAALDAATKAQPAWARVTPRERAELLRKAFEGLIANSGEFASVIRMETGKPLDEAHGEVIYAAEYLRWFSEEAVRIHARVQTAPEGRLRQVVSRKPIGPCVLVTPWNFPLAMLTRKVGPAVAAGCTMLVKPSELTPFTAACFAELMARVGLPPGVLNVIPTTRAESVIDAILADPRLRKLSFTGSTRIGRQLLRRTAENIQRCSLELGGNAPFLVFKDADMEAAVEGAVQAKLRNAGQACTAANRFLVHEAVAEMFVDRLGRRFSEIGRMLPKGGKLGPLISATARANVHAMVVDAVTRGSDLIVGGFIPEGAGHYYPPTLLSNVAPGSRVLDEEIFGPVAPVQCFSEDEEALRLANATPYGLAAYAYTSNLDRALWLQEELDVGMLGVNSGMISDPAAPFGGVKHSGLGREGGVEGIDEYLSIHYAAIGHTMRSGD